MDVFSFLFDADCLTISFCILPMTLDRTLNLKIPGQPCVRNHTGIVAIYIYVITFM